MPRVNCRYTVYISENSVPYKKEGILPVNFRIALCEINKKIKMQILLGTNYYHDY